METLLLCFCLVITGILLFISIYFIITLSDLECDYLNPQECCEKLNFCIIPRLTIQMILDIIFFIAHSWILLMLNVTFTAWLFYEKFSVPRDSLGIYDPIEIHNRGQIKKNMRNSICVCGFYLLNFFFTMYAAIVSLLKSDVPLANLEETDLY